jgi:hypothetical protein
MFSMNLKNIESVAADSPGDPLRSIELDLRQVPGCV